MENKDTKPKSGKRRTKKELEEIIWAAFERLVIAEGFNNITLIKLAREAGVEPPVVYKRFKDMDALFEQYAWTHDYWLNHSVSIDPELSPKENLIKVLTNLIDNLYENEIMQRILLWELNDTHTITRRMVMSREFENAFMVDYVSNGLKNSGMNVNIINSILITGLYYLIIHRKISTFCMVNYNSEESKEQMKQTVRDMVNKIFDA
jgi:AcrR family transcriptional regulator